MPRSVPRWLLAAVALAAAWLVLTSLYGLTAPAVFGHYGYHLGEYATRARHSLRSGTLLPYNAPGWTLPGPETLYLHHPLLTHHLVTVAFALLGDHETSVRLAALFPSLAALLAFAALLLRTDGPAVAAPGALLFALVPIHLWYTPLLDVGLPSIACLLLFFRAYFSYLATPRTAHLGQAMAWLALSAGFEWSPYLAILPVGLHALGVGARRRDRTLALVPLLALALLLPLALHFWIVHRTGHLAEMRQSYAVRTTPLDLAFYGRRILTYARAYFGLPLLVVTPLWLLGAAVRALRGQGRPRDLVGVSFLFALLVYVGWFRDGVNTHGYRMLYGGTVVALAALGVADDAASLLAARTARAPLALAPALALLLALLTLPASVAGLRESRAHQGIPDWTTFDPFLERSTLARAVRATARPGDCFYVHPGFPLDRRELTYYLDLDQRTPFRPSAAATLSPEARAHALLIFPLRGLSLADRDAVEALREHHPYRQIGGFAWIDLRTEGRDAQAFALDPPRADRSALRRYLDGPYPWPELRPLP